MIVSVKGGKWDVGAISNATWSGARLSEVLEYAGLGKDIGKIQHIQFEGLDRDFEKNYGASIPVFKALSDRVVTTLNIHLILEREMLS